jgi:hypothetical protein
MPALPYNAAPAPTIAGGGATRPGRWRLVVRAAGRQRTRTAGGRDAVARLRGISAFWHIARLSYACQGESGSAQRRHWIPQSAVRAPKLPGAERGTVNGMLPDFRFVLGATLAIALLAVAGLGLVTSVQLVREARLVPIEDARTLAFAGHTEWNQFYDPDGARRFEGLAGKTEGPVAPARLEAPAETSAIAPIIAPMIAPLDRAERTTDIPPPGLDPDLTHEDITHERTLELDPPPVAETPAGVTIAAAPAETAAVPAPDAPVATVSPTPPAERVASAPTTSPGPDLETQAPTQPQAGADPLPVSAPPTPRARPKAHFRKRIARVHFRRVAPTSQQTWPNVGIPTTDAPWPGYDNQLTGATTPKKSTGKLTGTLSNRPQ